MKAEQILDEAKKVLAHRGQYYTKDNGQGERNMKATVEAFNALFGASMTVTQGWYFMALLKMKRGAEDPAKSPDHFVDGANYMALAGEENSVAEPSNATVAKACGCGQCQMWEKASPPKYQLRTHCLECDDPPRHDCSARAFCVRHCSCFMK